MKKQNKEIEIKKEKFKRNKKTGHPSLPIGMTKRYTKSIGFTHDPDETYTPKYEMKKNIDPSKPKEIMYAKIKLENQKNSSYKDEPKYQDFRISKEDRKAIDAIKKGKYKQKK